MAYWNTIFQSCWYVGNNFNVILYGVAVMFYLMSARLILKSRQANHRKHGDRWLLVLNTGLIMITIYLISQNFFGQEMWVINEGYPGGSGQYYADHAATLGSAASVVLCLMSDAFLIYRTYVVWMDWRVVIMPSILCLCAAGPTPTSLWASRRMSRSPLDRRDRHDVLCMVACASCGRATKCKVRLASAARRPVDSRAQRAWWSNRASVHAAWGGVCGNTRREQPCDHPLPLALRDVHLPLAADDHSANAHGTRMDCGDNHNVDVEL